MATRIYFDTEFSSLWDPQLISVGMISEDDRTLYVEVEYDPSRNSRFTNEVVVPLLDGTPMAAADAAQAVRNFLTGPQYLFLPELVCDFIGDWWILQMLVPDLAAMAFPRCARNVGEGVRDACQRMGVPQHHALNDARALRLTRPDLQIE